MLISLPAFLYIFRPQSTSAAWWNDSYAFRQQIIFTHDTALTNASMRLTVSNTNTLVTAGKMQADCDDSRFTDSTGKVLKYHLVSGCNTASTVYDVVFPTVLNGSNLAWFYYGNSSAVSASDNSVPAGTTPSGSVTFASEEKGVSPALYLKFDEGTGSITKDLTFNGNNGGIRGALWKDQGSCLFENCLYYDGIDDQVIATNSSSIDFDQELVSGSSFQAWVKVNSTGENSVGRIFDKGNATYLRTTNSSNGKADLEASLDLSDTDAMATVSGGLTLNKWHLVTMAYTDDGDDEISVYIDGVLKATSSLGNGSPVSGDNNNLLIGGQNQKHFNGFIDEFKIYPYERTAAQIKIDLAKLPSLHGKSVSVGDDKSVANNGLIGWWKLDENVTGSNATDSAGLANSMLKNNSTTSFTSGKFGNAAWFNAASTDYFSTGSTINNIKTVSFWASPSATTDEFINLTASSYITASSGTVTFTGAGSPKIYVNGDLNGTLTANAWNLITVTSSTPINSDAFQIGKANGSYTNGKIDDVRLYNRAFTPTEAHYLYDWGPGPVGWWKLDEGSGSTAYDSSGNGNNGTIINNPLPIPGKAGQAYLFNGVNNYITLPNSSTLKSNDGTVSFWVAPTSDDDENVFSATDGTSTNVFTIKLGTNATTLGNCATNELISVFDMNGSIASQTCYITTNRSELFNSGWHQVAVTQDTKTRIYLDGVERAVQQDLADQADFTSNTNLNNFRIANQRATTETNFVNGKIDDVRIYNYARTQKQIVSDMNAGHPAVGSKTPVGYWKFDEGYDTTAHNSGSLGSVADGSLQSMDSPATYGSGWTNNGKFGKALVFDGSNDYVKVPDQTSFNFDLTDSFSMGAWIYRKDDLYGSIVDKEGPGPSYTGHTLAADRASSPGLNPNSVKAELNSNHSTVNYIRVGSPTNSLLPNGWHHVFMTYNGNTKANGIKIYIDGISQTLTVATDNLSGSITNNADLRISNPAGVNNGTLNGMLDEVKVYNYVLNSDEVKTEYNQGKALVLGSLSTNPDGTASNSASRAFCPPGDTATCNPPVGYWNFDENTNSTANDISGNGNTGTLTNGPKWDIGKIGLALKFDGVDDYIDVPENDALDYNGTGLTVSTWFSNTSLPNATTQNESIVGKFYYNSSTDNGGWLIKLWYDTPNVYLDFALFNSSGIETDGDGMIIFTDTNRWHQATGTYNGSTINLYLDGKLVDSESYSGGIKNVSNSLQIAADNGSSDYLGKIDDIRIYNYARTPAQIAWDYNRGGPVGWWKFDECQGSTNYDSSGNNYTQTITTDKTTVGTCSTSSTMWGGDSGDSTTNSGKYNYALTLNGKENYASTSGTVLNAGSQITYSNTSWGGWYNPTTEASLITLLQKNREFTLTTDANSKPKCSIWTAGNWSTAAVSSTALSLDTWQHILCTYDGSNIKIYINGILKGSTAQTASIMSLNYTPLTSGRNFGGSAYYSGRIDDLRVYNYALTPTQIKILYNDNSAVRFAPLTGSP